MKLREFSPEKIDLSSWGLGPFPLDNKLESILQRDPDHDWADTGLNRNIYLDMTERIVRMAAKWVDHRGAVIDPVIDKEWGQTTPRFCASAASLLYFNRATDLEDVVYRAMDYACEQLQHLEAKAKSPDFWMRDLTWTYALLRERAPKVKVEKWKADLSKVNPEAIYSYTDPTHTKLNTFHNWAVYSSAGESMRESLGIGSVGDDLWGQEFFDTYMEGQVHRFTDHGMYRDPNDPFTYDITTRLQFTISMAFGYDGPMRVQLEEIERRGALSTLLSVSPEGYVPYGGRSSQFQFQEAMASAMFEWEARRYRDTNPRLAGAFKRQAHLCAQTSQKWFEAFDPIHHLKNGFDPKTRHGCDSYGHYSVYSLLASTMLGVAAVFSDDSISEAPAPAEVGGYTLSLRPAFHKVIANCGRNYIEVDPVAQKGQDATGLGRILLAGQPFGILPTMACPSNPSFVVADDSFTPQALACGPQWEIDGEVTRLADLDHEDLEWRVEVIEESQSRVHLKITYELKDQVCVAETYKLDARGLKVVSQVMINGKEIPFEYLLPTLADDGVDGVSIIVNHPKSLTLKYQRSCLSLTSSHAMIHEKQIVAVNRLGAYGMIKIPSVGYPVKISLSGE